MKKHIPNLITCMNVLCGSAAVYTVLYFDDILAASILILCGMFFDFFDGLTARLLNVSSELGKELDSLADVISFGLAPSIIASSLIRKQLGEDLINADYLLLFIPILIPAFSAFRLAKFNLDTRQTSSFIGMPTPANALFWISLAFTSAYNEELYMMIFSSPYILVTCVVLFSCLLIAELPMFSLKFKNFTWNDNKDKYLYFIMVLALLLVMDSGVLIMLIPLYVLVSFAVYLFGTNKDKQ